MEGNTDGSKVLPFEEQMSLSPDEFKEYRTKRMKWVRAQQTEIEPGYTDKTHDEKVKSWSGNLGQQMRWQAESGLNPYAGYSPEWREDQLRFEPNFDALVQEAFKRYLKWEWSYDEYLKRVSR